MLPSARGLFALVSGPALACALVAGCLCLAGCGAAPPTPDQAARAILASESLRAARVETLAAEAPGRCQETLITQAGWNRWIGLKIAQVSDVVTAAGPVCRLTVEETFRREAENWSHRALSGDPGSSGTIVLPVAVPTLVRIVEIRAVGRGVAEASFEWQWRPNQAGQRLGIDVAPRSGWAQLVLDDRGWRATRVELGAR